MTYITVAASIGMTLVISCFIIISAILNSRKSNTNELRRDRLWQYQKVQLITSENELKATNDEFEDYDDNDEL